MIPADTEREAFEVQLDIWRHMDPETKFAQVVQLCDDGRQLVVEGIRARHPEYDEDQVKHASFRLFLGDDLYRQAWPDREMLPS